jgi:S-adenosyl methyltransferase
MTSADHTSPAIDPQAGGGARPGLRPGGRGRPAGTGALPGINVRIPSPARMYDFYLGGKDNFPADRDAARNALAVVPSGKAVAWANRRFLVRAVKHLAQHGVDQFIDLGTGIPTSPNVHEAARSIQPRATVVYADNDPIVTVHSRALLATDAGIAAIWGDIRDPQHILFDSAVRALIDFRKPVGLLFVAVLHFIIAAEDPAAIVAEFANAVPPGSHLVISHITSDGTDPQVMAAIEDAYRNASAPAVFRTRDEIAGLFAGFPLAPPGLTEVSAWRAPGRPPTRPSALRFLGGAGIKA